MRYLTSPALPLTGVLALAGCQHDVITPFPTGLEPLETCSPGLPAARSDGTVPEDFNSASGQGDAWIWAHLCGYVHGDVDMTWQALQDADVITDRRKVSQWDVTAWGDEPDYDVSFTVHDWVEDIITVEYDLSWREGIWLEQDGVPRSVAIRWQKTEGTSFISLLEGSILVQTVDDGVVSVQVVEHLDAPQYQPDAVETYEQDLYASVVAWVHGDPLPVYD